MKFKLLSLSLFSITALSPFIVPSFIPSAQAGCIAIDVGTQVAIDGQRQAHQSNHTSQNFGANCNGTTGSKVTTVGTQTCVSGSCSQRRNSSQFVDGDPNSRIGVRIPNIGIQVRTPVHVYNPSLDPNSPLNTNPIFHSNYK